MMNRYKVEILKTTREGTRNGRSLVNFTLIEGVDVPIEFQNINISKFLFHEQPSEFDIDLAIKIDIELEILNSEYEYALVNPPESDN